MAAIAAVNRPPTAHPRPNAGNLNSYPNGSVPNSGQQDPGLHGTNQDPGPTSHPQHHVSARPVFYVPAPPPPPFLHYQWPMPFYTPFTGFPGMGYGMVMPPFPPPPYMEAPAYILPHPHIQPVDYRRLLHPQVHVPSAPYQHPNQTRRVRLPHTGPVRETVNSEVQTEPTLRGVGNYGVGSPLVSSDSGHGTSSNSPSSSSSSSQKQGSTDAENYILGSSAKDFQINRTCTGSTVKHDFNKPQPTGTKTVESRIGATLETQKSHGNVGQVNVGRPCRGDHCNMWSVDSPDSIVPVCSSSQQEDEVVKERRVSIPDILSWGGGTPQAMMLKLADKVPPQSDHQLPSYETEVEHEKSLYQRENETKTGPAAADRGEAHDDVEGISSSTDGETLLKILKLPFTLNELLSESRKGSEPLGLGSVRNSLSCTDELLHSLNESHRLHNTELEDGNGTNPHEDTTEIIPYQIHLNSYQMKRKMNESVWSVESLAPFIPTKEWLQKNGMLEPEVIVEMIEEAENGGLSTQNDNLIVKSVKERRRSRRFSSSDSVRMLDSWLSFSTPAEKQSPSKKPEIESEIYVSEMTGPKQGQSVTPSEKVPLASPTHQSRKILFPPNEEDADENGSSEPEAKQSPNQESLILNEEQEKSPCSPEQEENLLLNSVAEEKILFTGQLTLQNGDDLNNEACEIEEVSLLRNKQLCIPTADQKAAEVSLSKTHLVDCGTQCTELHKCRCEEPKSNHEPSRGRPFKYPDMTRVDNGKPEASYMSGTMQKNQKRYNPWKNRGQGTSQHHLSTEKQSSQQEGNGRYHGKTVKSKGGNGRNPRY